MVKQLLSSIYQIKKVVDGPKLVEENGKKVAFYKVRWQVINSSQINSTNPISRTLLNRFTICPRKKSSSLN
jgi:hypothetical protein